MRLLHLIATSYQAKLMDSQAESISRWARKHQNDVIEMGRVRGKSTFLWQ